MQSDPQVTQPAASDASSLPRLRNRKPEAAGRVEGETASLEQLLATGSAGAASDILIVTANADNRAALERLLGRHVARGAIRAAASVAEGVAQARRRPPDVMLLDNALPDGDAADVLVRLMVARGMVLCPVVVLLEDVHQTQALRLLRLGAGDYLAKRGIAPPPRDGAGPLDENAAAAMLDRSILHAREQHRLSRRAALYRANTLLKRRRERAALDAAEQARDEADAQRRAAERAREGLDLAVGGAELGTWDWYPATGRVVHNDRLLTMLGYEPGELDFSYTQWRGLMHPQDVARTVEALGRHLEGHTERYRVEYRLRTRSGQWKWVLVTGQVVGRDELGRPTRVAGVHLDIDDRKRAELALVEAKNYAETAQQQLVDMVTSIRDAFLLLDRDWKYTYVNPSAEKLLGRSAAELVGMVIWDAWEGLADSPLADALRRAMRQREMTEVTAKYEALDKWFDARIYPAEEGAISLFLIDVTAGKRSEAALRESERHNRLLVNAARQLGGSLEPEAIYARLLECVRSSMRCDGMIVSAFSAAEGVIRANYAWVSGNVLDASTLPPLKFNPQATGMQTQVILTGKPMLFGDVAERVRDPKGTYYEVDAKGEVRNLRQGPPPQAQSAIMVPLLSEGAVVGVVQVMADAAGVYTSSELELLEGITLQLGAALQNARLYRRAQEEIEERRKAERELREAKEHAESARVSAERAKELAERANKAKSEFLAVLSHELRTPLTPVLAGVQMLQQELEEAVTAAGDAETLETLATIRRNVELEVRLIDDLLDLTRITRGKLQLSRKRIDLNSSVRHVVEICRAEIEEKNLRLELALAEGPAGVLVDPARLQQALWNLLKNAVKFTPPGGTITVRSFPGPTSAGTSGGTSGGTWCCQVIDTGVGIEPELLPTIFNAFEQGGESVTRTFGGLGLGLAITRALVVAHGGTLTAHSEGRGRGASFTLALPAHALSPAADEAQSAPAPAPSRSSRVLLVEDHADTARLMARFLERRLGVSVLCAAGVAEAAAAWQRESAEAGVDLVISDIGLPDGTGMQLLRRLTRLSGGVCPPAIALSGYGTEQDIKNSRTAGFREHIIKPVDLDRLEQAVRQVLR